MQKFKYLTFLIGLLFFSNTGFAFTYDANFSLGNLCEFVGKIQTNDNGSTNTCEFNPYLSGALDIPLTSQFIVSPELGFTFPKHGRDDNISKMTLFALANTKYHFGFMYILGGAGLYFTRISASGGTEELNNGTSTSSFPLPEGAVYSRNFIVNAGLGVNFTKEFSADLHTYVFNLLSSDDRAFSVLINGTYHFGEF